MPQALPWGQGQAEAGSAGGPIWAGDMARQGQAVGSWILAMLQGQGLVAPGLAVSAWAWAGQGDLGADVGQSGLRAPLGTWWV